MKIAILIPTYNEGENITRLIERLSELKLDSNILIVDDGSPDGTGKIVEKLKEKYKNLHIIHREGKLGLGSAYIKGFKYIIENMLEVEAIQCMDADFSHNPKEIPNFIKKMQETNCDVVLGSRYIKGGGVNWAFHRTILSRGANLMAKTLLGLKPKDVTGAFRLFKKEALESINLYNIKSEGFSFFEEILYTLKNKNCKMEEVPIFFLERKKGKSKLSKKEMAKFFITMIKLRLTK